MPPVPLDWCGAQTQATIGMLVLDTLDQALVDRGLPVPVAALVSRTLVDEGDPGFSDPTKPIGRYADEDEAALMIELGQHWKRIAGPRVAPRGRLTGAAAVPGLPAAKALITAGYVVVCSGGGGIPTVRREGEGYVGVEAVIDKDLTAALLAEQVLADVLVIATDVEAAVIGWGTPEAVRSARSPATSCAPSRRRGTSRRGRWGPRSRP